MNDHPKWGKTFRRAYAAFEAGRNEEAERICRRILAAGDFPDASHLLATTQMAMGKNDLALVNLDRVLAARPGDAEALTNRGIVLKRLKRPEAALASLERVLSAHPDHSRALFNRALLLHEMRRREEALTGYDCALRAQPGDADLWTNRGILLQEMKRHREALASFERALALRPEHIEALTSRGAALYALNRGDEALASFAFAITLRPDYLQAHLNSATVLRELNRDAEALPFYERALRLQPRNPDIWIDQGAALYALKRFGDALASYDRALALRPGPAELYSKRAAALIKLERFDEALANFDEALAVRADYPEALNNRAVLLKQLGRPEEALTCLDRAVALRPDYVEALNNRGGVLIELKRLEEALESYDRALSARPGDSYALGGVADCAAKLCDWPKRADVDAKLTRHIGDGGFIAPFVLFGYRDDAAIHLQCARNYTAARLPALPQPLWRGETWRHDKIRLAYFASDFRSHALGYTITDLFETHDRSRFEVVGVSHGGEDGSRIRKRIVASFDAFYDVTRKDDAETARLLHDLGIDIVVDLQAYTGMERPGILARRPAPIQVNYVGFPGTIGAPFVDYIMTDAIVAPFERQPFFTEKIVHLPDCYLVNDRRREVAARIPTRREMGLPESGFVFCCFNNNWKITPAFFDLWMSLLREVPGSTLWLLRDNEGAARNLRQAAGARDVDPARLIFADRVPSPQHLARHALADLFLDTLPYNAHSTAADALRTGIPILTCVGTAFPSRVAASHLHAIGMPELIVSNLEEYRALAAKIAREPATLAALKSKLLRNRATHPLFDTPRVTRGIEAAYHTMWKIWQRGEAPTSFTVPAD